MTSAMSAIQQILSALADLAWVRSRGGIDPLWPPFIAFRFAEPREPLYAEIAEAVSSFSGEVEWSMTKGRRNWVIMPKDLQVFSANFRVDVDADSEFAREFPEATRRAINDVVSLAEHMRARLLPT